MALQKTVNTLYGLEALNAYHRVERITIVNKRSVNFDVCSYSDVNFPAFAVNEYSCSYNLDGENPIKQSYEYLKTLPKFADATDV